MAHDPAWRHDARVEVSRGGTMVYANLGRNISAWRSALGAVSKGCLDHGGSCTAGPKFDRPGFGLKKRPLEARIRTIFRFPGADSGREANLQGPDPAHRGGSSRVGSAATVGAGKTESPLFRLRLWSRSRFGWSRPDAADRVGTS